MCVSPIWAAPDETWTKTLLLNTEVQRRRSALMPHLSSDDDNRSSSAGAPFSVTPSSALRQKYRMSYQQKAVFYLSRSMHNPVISRSSIVWQDANDGLEGSDPLIKTWTLCSSSANSCSSFTQMFMFDWLQNFGCMRRISANYDTYLHYIGRCVHLYLIFINY